MKSPAILRWFIFMLTMTFTACDKNYTVFYEDDDAEDLSVFSNMGNNVMSCYINGKPFRTRDRKYNHGFSSGYLQRDIELFKDTSVTGDDTLTIVWQSGALSPNPYSVSLVLAVTKDFSYNDFTAFTNTRLVIDGSNGYFMVNNNRSEKGTGTIYFQRATLMPTNVTGDNNILSGVFEATLPSYKITRGRFDHTLPIGEKGVVFF